MAQRIASSMALIAFAVCLCIGINAGNAFGTVITRALLAMLVTLCVAAVLGWMAQKMLEENLKVSEEKLKNGAVSATEDGR